MDLIEIATVEDASHELETMGVASNLAMTRVAGRGTSDCQIEMYGYRE